MPQNRSDTDYDAGVIRGIGRDISRGRDAIMRQIEQRQSERPRQLRVITGIWSGEN